MNETDSLHASRLLDAAPSLRRRPRAWPRVKRDGVLPEGFFSTTNLPTYVRVGRRVAHAARAADGLGARARRAMASCGCARVGACGRASGSPSAQAEDGREGIYVHATGFMDAVGERRRVQVHVERGLAREADRLRAAWRGCSWTSATRRLPVWVDGPALVHSRARNDMVWFIQQRLRQRAARGERRRGARHRGVDLRHHARHERRRGRRRRAGTGCTCARSTRCARPARSPRRCANGTITRRHHARLRDDEHAVRAHAAPSATTARCPT